MPTFDETDREILTQRTTKRDRVFPKPRVGDFALMPDGEVKRFSHEWEDGYQVSEGGSFYLSENGSISFSGELEPTISNGRIYPTSREKMGWFWIFHHDEWEAHNGVNCMAPCRVYKVLSVGGQS